MLTDSQELEVTTDSLEAVNAINGFFEQLLSVGNDSQVILKAVEADPACAIANAHAAAFYMFSGTADALTRSGLPLGIAQATDFLNSAKAHVTRANEREQLYIAAIEAWIKRDIRSAMPCGKPLRVYAHHEGIAESFERDLVSLHICQYHYRNSGDSQGMLRIAEKVLPANRDSPYMYGMLAFGLEESSRLPEAELAGRRATEMKRDNRWAHHAVAHVLETQGRLEEGIAWMESVCDTWENSNPAFYSHLWWHTALYHLDAEHIVKVLEIYDTKIWGRAWKDNGREQINAISLLLRLELRGVDVGSRFSEVAAYLQPRLHEHILGFMDLHYLYALVRGGKDDWAAEMLESMQLYSQKALPYIQAIWLEVVLPSARGMIAYAHGNLQTVITELESVLPRLQETGGSHAQRDLFEQVYLDALIHTSRYHEALSILEKRHAKRSNIPVIQQELAHIYQKLGRLVV